MSSNTLVSSGVGAILGFLISQGLSFYQFTQTVKNTNRIVQIAMMARIAKHTGLKPTDL
jgi:hypothetical protein